MCYYLEPDCHITDKIKVVLGLTDYSTKNKLYHAAGVESYLSAKKDFIALKAEVDNVDTNKLVNVPTSLNNLKTK